MSNQCWVQINNQVYGPYSPSDVKKFAVEGRVQPNSIVCLDGTTWQEAGSVEGLFASVAAPSRHPPLSMPSSVPQDDGSLTQSEFPMALAYQGPASAGNYAATAGDAYQPLRRRSAVGFIVSACLMFVTGAIVTVMAYGGFHAQLIRDGYAWVAVVSAAAFLFTAFPALIYWLTWVHGVHKDLRALTAGQYSISPGQAVGFSFIPVFDGFWAIYMPWRAANELNRHLAANGLAQVPTGAVMACQTLSVMCALFLPPLTPVLYAISMCQVQAGMNRLINAAG